MHIKKVNVILSLKLSDDTDRTRNSSFELCVEIQVNNSVGSNKFSKKKSRQCEFGEVIGVDYENHMRNVINSAKEVQYFYMLLQVVTIIASGLLLMVNKNWTKLFT
jgi:hypothetical protein